MTRNLAVLLLAPLLAACGADLSTPTGTVEAFLAAAASGDAQGARAYLVRDEREVEGLVLKERKVGNYSVGIGGIYGTRAEVPVTKDDRQMIVVLLQEDGKWLVSLKETMKKAAPVPPK